MSRLLRPYIPLEVRLAVVTRMLYARGACAGMPGADEFRSSTRVVLERGLKRLFPDGKYHLDHNPALENRPFNKRTGKYTPDANDPLYLIYRTPHDHKIKTLVRGDGAQLSDAAIARKRKRTARKRDPKRRVAKIQSRKNNKWPSRPFPSNRRNNVATRPPGDYRQRNPRRIK